MIKVELTEIDAELFREFRRVQDMLRVLNDAGVFQTKNGKIILNFNEDGVLTDIKVDKTLYKRKHNSVIPSR